MDLRRRLLGSLSLLLGGLMAIATLVQLHSLRDDIDAEIAASAQLVNLLANAGEPSGETTDGNNNPPATKGLRHLDIRTTGQKPTQNEQHPLHDWLGLTDNNKAEYKIQIGEQTFFLTPKPDSEIEERLSDTVQLLITLLLFSGATLLVAWWSADRALRPVRDLEAGLQRLADGKSDPALPNFALREFRQVASAINSLAQALTESRAAQSALARQLISVQENERRALARDLHDEMGQSLTALSVTAAHLERNAGRLDATAITECARDLRRDIRSSNEQLRSMLKSLRPHGLDAAGLGHALRELVCQWQNRETGIDFALKLPDNVPEVDESTALTLYRVVQEALTNVVRHSQARRCEIVITLIGDKVRAEINDNGTGFPQAAPANRGGLLGMLERVEMANGKLEMMTNPEGGLCLIVQLPKQSVWINKGINNDSNHIG